MIYTKKSKKASEVKNRSGSKGCKTRGKGSRIAKFLEIQKNSNKNSHRREQCNVRNLGYVVAVEREIERAHYIYGTARELADYLKIPISTFYRLIRMKNFIFEKIKEGRRTYYLIMRRDIVKNFKDFKEKNKRKERR